jgi:hypothetical protein
MGHMRVLIFTIANNGYDAVYQRCIKSQADYAKRYKHEFVVVKKPYFLVTEAASDSAWLKIPLSLAALKKGYERVMFIDADCLVKRHCPDPTNIYSRDKTVYVCLGFSGRMNSGVFLVENATSAKWFFSALIASAGTYKLPEEDQAPHENGTFISLGKYCPFIEILPSLWNNNQFSDLNDSIRHYTGPLKKEFRAPLFGRMRRRLLNELSNRLLKNLVRAKSFDERLRRHYFVAVRRYDSFFEDYGIDEDLRRNVENRLRNLENESDDLKY